ncbi:facilitated trehalose transporter Tret1 [Nasonia vitripennis]|uniref:Major facilitator superfamily (MFS) profile domain-containing protein n=1 Tax=Nasonia vitripennis TaxID=7425 RepID=A0A7M7G2D3_NASVI|nr:facilitated trehalose transporter Tret1 [Nasonia vitripennis]
MEPSSSSTASNRHNEISLEDNQLHEVRQIPKSNLKRALCQYCATLSSSLLTLSIGMSIGFSTILIPQLYQKNAEIIVSLEELTWIGSMNYILTTVGAIASGMFAQWLGRKIMIVLLTMPYIVSWLILHYSTNSWMLFTALTLTGLSGGLSEAPIQTYVAEISEPALRGSLSATVSMSIMIGIFLQFLIAGYLYWRTLVLVNLAVPIACLLLMIMMPESPHWLITKNRFDDAERALCWLRGWTTASDVREEYQTVFHTPATSRPVNEIIIDRKSSRSQFLKKVIKPYLRKAVLLPFCTVSYTFFVSCFNGSTPLLIFAIPLFEKFNSPINEYTATMIMGLLKVIASLLLILLIRYTGKRKLIFLSLAGTGASLLIVAIYSYARDHCEIDVKDYTWIPTAMILISVFASTLGIKGIPWIISGEVFPTDVRSVANGLVSSTCNVYSAIASKVFLYMIRDMTMAGTFLFFAMVNVMGLIVLYFILPETEGRTLKEIEDHYAGVCKFKDASKPMDQAPVNNVA